MQKFNFNKIINGIQRAPIKLTVKAIHISVITHEPVISCANVTVASGVKLNDDIRLSLTNTDLKKLRLIRGNRLALTGIIKHNKYCLWICRPAHLRKITEPFLMLRMQKYLFNHAKLVKESMRKRNRRK